MQAELKNERRKMQSSVVGTSNLIVRSSLSGSAFDPLDWRIYHLVRGMSILCATFCIFWVYAYERPFRRERMAYVSKLLSGHRAAEGGIPLYAEGVLRFSQ
jgi:hypothetical protein